MTSYRAGALLLIAALATGCSSGASSAVQPSSPASSAPADQGKVTVRLGVVYAGGPAGTSSALRSGTVRLVGNIGIVPTIVPVNEGKRTPVQLAPGFYLVSASSGDAICVTTQTSIRPGPPVDVTVTCSVK